MLHPAQATRTGLEPWGLQRPSQKGWRVAEPEHVVIVLHVVITEQLKQLQTLSCASAALQHAAA